MKSILSIFLVTSFFLFTSLKVCAQQADSLKKMPLLQTERKQTIDVKHIAIDLQFDWEKRQAMGIATIRFSPVVACSKILLDAGMLTINSIATVNGKALKYTYDGRDKSDGLEIILDRNYKVNEIVIIKIDYHTNYENKTDPNNIGGSFGKGLRFFEPTYTTPSKHKQIWSSGEPDNNKYWFPCNEDIADIHTTEITATIEKPLMLISNGNLVETTENKDNTRTFRYKTSKPFPNYLVSIVVGAYYDVIQNSIGIPIHNYGYPNEKEAVKATTELLPDMMKFISEKTGYQYPYTQYSQVVVQDYPFPGLNGQNAVSTMSDNYIDDYGVHKDFKYLWDGVAVQAMAGQWFGNLIMPKKWDDIWLNNAFTQYFAGQYTAKNNGDAEYLLWYLLPWEKASVIGDWNNGYKHPIVTDKFTDIASFSSDNYSKFRGAMVLRMLQNEMGDNDWWKAIKTYVYSNAQKQVSTKDFQYAIETTTGKSYQWFFDQWIYKIGLPKFEVTKMYDANKKQLIIAVKQVQVKDSISEYEQVGFFNGKVAIEIDDKIEQVNIEPKAENRFIFSSPKEPPFVNFDFEEVWICETKFEKSTDEYLLQLKNSKDILAKQKALDALVLIAKDSSTTNNTKQIIIAAFKNEITSTLYWRYRAYALGSLRKIIVLPYDTGTISFLLNLIKTEKSWLKTSAIFSLGNTEDAKYADIYIDALDDESDRVINAAAVALGKSKSPKAYKTLIKLDSKPSWKSQSRISALNGLQQLGDSSAVNYILNCLSDNQSPRWYLATPVWDYPFAAANTLVALGKGNLGFPIIFERFKKSLLDDDLNDIFQNVQLINILADTRSGEVYDLLKEKFKNDADVLAAVIIYENQFKEAIK